METNQQPPIVDEKTYKWVPQFFKDIYDAAKVWHWIILALAEVMAIFFGVTKGKLAGYSCGFGMLLVWGLFQLLRVRWKHALVAIHLLDGEKHKDDPVYAEAAKGLRRARREAIIGLLSFFFISLVELGFLVIPPVYYLLTQEKPKSLVFAEFSYYRPTQDEHNANDAPFVEALIISLKNEGLAVGRPFRIALGKTVPIGHPTPAFQCSLQIADEGYEATGYAFRIHPDQNRICYESISAEYPSRRTVLFKLPPCDKGDRMFIVARITSSKEDFPEDLVKVAKLDLLNQEK
jgi:hypothetical protein